MSCFEPADNTPLDGNYYQIFYRLNQTIIQIFLGYTTTPEGDNEFDRIAAEIDLTYLAHTVDDPSAAEERGKSMVRKLHPASPIEIYYMEVGELVTPGLWLLPVRDDVRQTCHLCGCDSQHVEKWRSAGRFSEPLFCSTHCATRWYVDLPISIAARPIPKPQPEVSVTW